MARFCDVALAVPLRRTFTYSIPDFLHEAVSPGTRVVVPFGKRSLVGVVTTMRDAPPAETKTREIAQVLDAEPALSPALLDLGSWLSNYYVAPVGEVMRAMLPPAIEVRQSREVALTQAGSAALEKLRAQSDLRESQQAELAVLEFLAKAGKPVGEGRLRKYPEQHAAVLRLLHRHELESREGARERARRTQTIVAWRATYLSPATSPAEERLREALRLLSQRQARLSDA